MLMTNPSSVIMFGAIVSGNHDAYHVQNGFSAFSRKV